MNLIETGYTAFQYCQTSVLTLFWAQKWLQILDFSRKVLVLIQNHCSQNEIWLLTPMFRYIVDIPYCDTILQRNGN